MSILIPSITFLIGFVMGLGAMILYIQYSMYSQMSDLEKHMDDMQDIASSDFDIPADVEEVEASEVEKKEEKG